MTPYTVFLAVVVVVGMATGQILFKIASGRGDFTAIFFSPFFWSAAVLYGVITVFWVLLLREVELSRAYPVIAATYLIVPAASVFLFGEKVGSTYVVGVALVIVGIILTVRS